MRIRDRGTFEEVRDSFFTALLLVRAGRTPFWGVVALRCVAGNIVEGLGILGCCSAEEWRGVSAGRSGGKGGNA